MTASEQGTPQIWRWLLLELAIGALALVATGFLPPALRPIARTGSFCALVSGLVSLAAVHLGCARSGSNGLFAAIGVGFFSRMVLLALGLLFTSARDAALAYALTFFAVFVLTQATEIAYVLSRSRRLPARAA